MAKFYVTIGLLALGICFANGKIIKHNYYSTVKGELTFGSFITECFGICILVQASWREWQTMSRCFQVVRICLLLRVRLEASRHTMTTPKTTKSTNLTTTCYRLPTTDYLLPTLLTTQLLFCYNVGSAYHECWHIFAEEGFILKAWTPEFNLERGYDFMHVYCGPNGDNISHQDSHKQTLVWMAIGFRWGRGDWKLSRKSRHQRTDSSVLKRTNPQRAHSHWLLRHVQWLHLQLHVSQ